MKNKIFWAALILITIGAFSLHFYGSQELAPDVTFKTITGKQIPLKSLKGKPVLVTFWATDCRSCLQEIPYLIKLYDQFHSQGLEIIAVAMAYNPPNLIVEMTKARQLPYDVALDLGSSIAKSFDDVNLIPHTFLISPDGRIARNQLGDFNFHETRKLIEKYLQG